MKEIYAIYFACRDDKVASIAFSSEEEALKYIRQRSNRKTRNKFCIYPLDFYETYEDFINKDEGETK